MTPGRRPRPARWCLVVLGCLVPAACAGGPGPASPSARPPAASTSAPAPGPAPAPSSSPSEAPSSAPASGRACAAGVLAGLSVAQRVGQVFLVGIPSGSGAGAAERAAADADAGGVLLYGGSTAGTGATRTLTDHLSTVLRAADAGVPPLAATDQEGGAIQSLAGPGFDTMPSALVQGGWPVAGLTDAAARWGQQLRSAGVDVDLAPVVDVVPAALGRANRPIGRYDRQFGSEPGPVTAHGLAVVAGLQQAGVAAAVKHFPGLGRVRGNTDVTPDVTDAVTGPDDPSLEPFRAAVAAGVPLVMVSSALYPRIDPSRRAVFSPTVMSLLRDRLGFRGVIVSDDLGAAVQVTDVSPGERALRFLAAGGQLVVVVRPASVVAPMVAAVRSRAASDPTVAARVDAAATAVLTLKASLGLLPCR